MAARYSRRKLFKEAGPWLSVSAKMDLREYARAEKRLARYEGRPLAERARRAAVEGARLGVRPIRSSGRFKNRTGNLRASVSARAVRLRDGEMAAASVGPRGRKGGHKHLIADGHRIVTRSGQDTGRRTRPDPFVESAFKDYGPRAQQLITAQVIALGNTTFTGFGGVSSLI